jgi:hypothetical protein
MNAGRLLGTNLIASPVRSSRKLGSYDADTDDISGPSTEGCTILSARHRLRLD